MDQNFCGIRKRLASTQSSFGTPSSSRRSSFAVKREVFDPERAIHKPQDSLFSGSSGWRDFRGFFNLAILLLFVSNGRVALENLIKYGILVSPMRWVTYVLKDFWQNWSIFLLLLMSNITIISVFTAERLMASKWFTDRYLLLFYLPLFSLHICLPALITLSFQGNPLYSTFSLSIYVILFLKLTSYAHTNYWFRCINDKKNGTKDEKVVELSYPNNLTLKNLYYFVFAPTLCYELNYPRSPGRRKLFMLKRSAELVCLTFIIIALSQQWVAPLLRNSVEPFATMKIGHCIERVLKLAIPNHIIWLIFFYTIFHSAMNLFAEIMAFADRQFYLDFWNAETISSFWKSWNIPVHRWALRHIYRPMVANGYAKLSASTAVFFISAFFHEYLVSVPLHMFRLWAYYGMMAQLPLSFLTEKLLDGGRPGNIAMWLSLILGQPLIILMYVHDWYIIEYSHPITNGTSRF